MSTRNLRVVENTPDVETSDICAEKESLLTAFLKSSTRIFHVPSATVDMNLSKMPPKEVLVNLQKCIFNSLFKLSRPFASSLVFLVCMSVAPSVFSTGGLKEGNLQVDA
jgi:hypothetical protein